MNYTAQTRANNINALLAQIVTLTYADNETLADVEGTLCNYLSHLENQCAHCFDEGECPWCEEAA